MLDASIKALISDCHPLPFAAQRMKLVSIVIITATIIMILHVRDVFLSLYSFLRLTCL